jgi:hypothetical protein
MQLPFTKRAGTDPDALAYFARAGIASGTQTPSSYDNAASFNGTNQFLSRASNSTLTVTGTSFTYAFWANAVNTSNTQQIVCKTDVPGNAREYQILFTSGQLRFNVFPDGIFANRSEINIAAGPANSWNFYVCRYDAVAATIGISVNGGAFSSTGSVPAITQTNTNPVQFGANPGSVLFYSGALSSIGFWKRALTASEVTQLWNGGAGRTYASLDSGLRNNLVSWWALNQNSVTADSHGTNTLTNNGSVTAPNIGPIVTTTQNSRQLINNFVKGIKSLGLWNQMVCWPLRASQNASTTLTAQSLGGLGNFPATLANFGSASSAWASTGLSGASTNSVATTTLSLPTGNSSRAVLAAWQNFSNSQFIPIGSTTPDLNRLILRSDTPTNACADLFNGDLPNAFFGSVTVPSGVNFSAVSYNASNSGVLFKANSNTATSGTIAKSFASSNVIFGSYGSGATQGYGLYAFNMALNVPLDEVQIININSLYKQSLGLGLALP